MLCGSKNESALRKGSDLRHGRVVAERLFQVGEDDSALTRPDDQQAAGNQALSLQYSTCRQELQGSGHVRKQPAGTPATGFLLRPLSYLQVGVIDCLLGSSIVFPSLTAHSQPHQAEGSDANQAHGASRHEDVSIEFLHGACSVYGEQAVMKMVVDDLTSPKGVHKRCH